MSDQTPAQRPMPAVRPEAAPYWKGAGQHKLMVPRCTACGQAHLYPRPLCPFCSGTDLSWEETSGRGTVYSFTVVQRPPSPAFAADVPYVVAIVALDEGPHLLTNIVGEGAVDKVSVGAKVRVAFRDLPGDIALPIFELS